MYSNAAAAENRDILCIHRIHSKHTKAAAEEVVRFRFGSVEVDVPAGCLDAIRCLAESAGRAGTQVARSTPSAFHEIVLGARR